MEMGAPEIQVLLPHLETDKNVVASIHTAPAVGTAIFEF
jgi:hypothetical protein